MTKVHILNIYQNYWSEWCEEFLHPHLILVKFRTRAYSIKPAEECSAMDYNSSSNRLKVFWRKIKDKGLLYSYCHHIDSILNNSAILILTKKGKPFHLTSHRSSLFRYIILRFVTALHFSVLQIKNYMWILNIYCIKLRYQTVTNISCAYVNPNFGLLHWLLNIAFKK